MGKKINIDIDKLIKDYLAPYASVRTLQDKYKTPYRTLYAYLVKTKHPEVLKKMKMNRNKFFTKGISGFEEDKVKFYISQGKVTPIVKKYWDRHEKVIMALKCLHCGKINIIKKMFYSHKNCECGKNVIFFSTPNFLNCKVVYKSKYVNGYKIKSYKL